MLKVAYYNGADENRARSERKATSLGGAEGLRRGSEVPSPKIVYTDFSEASVRQQRSGNVGDMLIGPPI
jgi:hypothetical protein